MNITLISGSQQCQSQSAKIMAALAFRLENMAVVRAVESVDLAELALPLMDFSASAEQQQKIDQLGAKLEASDAFVIISPEWHGMVPAALKNFFLYYSGGQLAHKPALIVAISAGEGGPIRWRSCAAVPIKTAASATCRSI